MESGSAGVAVDRHSPSASIVVLWCSAIGCSQPSQMYAAVLGRPFSHLSRSNVGYCFSPQCGHRTKNRRWSEASYSRSIRERLLIVGVEARNTLRRQEKVRVLASASATGSPSSSADGG